MRDGFVVFVEQRDSYDFVVWRRNEKGVVERMAGTTFQPVIEDVGDDGSFVYKIPLANERRLVDAKGHESIVGHALGRAIANHHFWFLILGRNVFSVDF